MLTWRERERESVLQRQRATPILAHGTIAHGTVALHTRDYKNLMLDLDLTVLVDLELLHVLFSVCIDVVGASLMLIL